ncbi:MAG: VOC family protein [Bdellovibrionales bacterium]|nr:VOC family protein [Bdellovibrionales bacterium]
MIVENPVRWFEIYVQDISRAKSFYEDVFQFKLEKLESPESMTQAGCPSIELWAFPMSKGGPGAGGALVKMDGVPSGGSGTLIYFACADCSVEAARAEKAGGKIERPKFSIGQYGFISLIHDTEGNMIGLHSME